MGYRFDPLIHRMVDKYGWNEKEAEQCFEDLKRFLALAIVTGKSIIPAPKIDEMWHNFILFTADYEEFCLQYAGRFLHHRPRRRDDPKVARGHGVPDTLRLAQEMFGELSSNWDFAAAASATTPNATRAPAEASEGICTCEGNCGCPATTKEESLVLGIVPVLVSASHGGL